MPTMWRKLVPTLTLTEPIQPKPITAGDKSIRSARSRNRAAAFNEDLAIWYRYALHTAKTEAEQAEVHAAETSRGVQAQSARLEEMRRQAAEERRAAEQAQARAAETSRGAQAQSARLEEMRRQAAEERRAAELAKQEAVRVRAQADEASQKAAQAAEAAREKAEQARREAQASRGEAAQAELKRRELEAKIADAEARRQALTAARAEEEAGKRAAEAARLDAVAKKEATEEARRQEETRARTAREARQREEAAAKAAGEARQREEAAAKAATEARQREEATAREASEARRQTVERAREAQAALAQIEDKKRAAEAAQQAVEKRKQETEEALARAEAMRRDKRKQEEIAAAAEEARRREAAQKSAEAEASRLRSELAEARAAVEKSQVAQKQANQASLRAEDRRKAAEAEAGRLALARQQAQAEAQRAEGERTQAQAEVVKVRRDLDAAVAARQQEERRRKEAESARSAEEKRLVATEAARKAEEQRLAAVRAELLRLEQARAAAQAPTPKTANPPAPAQPAPPVARPAPPPKPAVVAAAPAAPAARPVEVQSIRFVDEPARSSVIIDLSGGAIPYKIERPDAHTVVMLLSGAQLGESTPRTLDTTEYLGPVRQVRTQRDTKSGGVRVTVDLADDVKTGVRQAGSRMYWDFLKSTPGPRGEAAVRDFRAPAFGNWQAATVTPSQVQPAERGKKRYTGRRLDIEFKDADIHNVLRLFSEVGQINIVVADDVRGSVTLRMKNVPWDQALDMVLRSKGLGQVREGNIIRVAPMATLEKELEQEIARQRQRIEVEPLETRMIPLSYAQGEEMQTKISNLLSSRGRVITDPRTNMLIVSDVPKNIELVEELSRSLDTQTAQVLVEARIVEARQNFSREVGIQWGFGYLASQATGNPTGLVFPSTVGVAGGATDGNTPTAGLLGLAQSPNFVVNMPAPVGTGTGGALGFTFANVGSSFNLALRLSAFENTGQIRTLSSPKIQTMDNVSAFIMQGTGIPISQVSAAGVNTQFIDAVMRLEVKPKVTNEGTVMLTINLQRNEPDFANTGARGDPTILKKEARTTLLVRDGDTAVVGGIFVRSSGWSLKKVPWLAEIPVLGWFFKEKNETDERSELLIFITPRILNRARSIGQ